MRATLFHQPEAGETPWPANRLISAMARAGIEAAYCSTTDEGWRTCLAAATGIVVAAGGDGTVGRVATALPNRDVRMGILPLGSANNVARSLGVFGEVEALVAGFAAAGETNLTIGTAHGRWGSRRFIEAVGIGAVARAPAELQDADLDGEHKRSSGRATLADMLRSAKPVRAAVALDGEPLGGGALMVEIMNLPMIGPNLLLAPERRPGEDTLTVAWLPEADRDAMIDWLAAPDGRDPAPLRHEAARCVTLDAHDERLRIDDKTVEWDGSRMTFSLEETPVKILKPDGAR